MKRMSKSQWEAMTLGELFALRAFVHDALSERLKSKNAELAHRLRILSRGRARSNRRSLTAVRVADSDA